MRPTRIGWILALVWSLPGPGAPPLPQDIDVGFVKGDSVVLTLPAGFAVVRRGGSSSRDINLEVEARDSNGVVEVRDPRDSTWKRDWQFGRFPSRLHFFVSNLKIVSRQDADGRFIEVTLTTPFAGFKHRLYAPAGQPQVIRALVAPLSAADSIRKVAYDSLGTRFFTGPLEHFTSAERLLLLRFADSTAQGIRLGSETYKGVTYLTMVLIGDGHTWNDLRVTRMARVGRVIDNQLALLKAFTKIAVPHTVISGLKLEQTSIHGTAPSYSDTKSDTIDAYFPLDAMLKFAAADITSQQLANQSIVLVNGDRVEVDLRAQ